MDALSVLRVLTRYRILLCLFALFCAWPVLSGLYFMITHHSWMLMDIDAVLCGARNLQQHHSPYAIHPTCRELRPAAYVYAPQVARIFYPFMDTFGVVTTRNLFVWLILWPATLFLLWFALVKRFPGMDIRYRLLAFGALTAMTFACANVGIVMHAMVLASLLFAPKEKWAARLPFTVVVLLCACVKPTFLAYFVIFMLDDITLWRRVFAFTWRAVLGLGVAYMMVLTDGHYGRAWQKTLHSVTMARQVGMGWFELTNFVFHVPGPSHLNVELAAGFMLVMLLSGMAISQWGKLEPGERLVLGMGLVPLMTPRLLDYDMILIVPYAALLISCVRRVGGTAPDVVLSWVFVGWLVWGIISNMMGYTAWHRTPMDMLMFGILTAIVAILAVVNRLSGGKPVAGEEAVRSIPQPA